MRNGIAALLAAASLVVIAGCDSNAEPSASSLIRYQDDAGRDRSWWLVRDGVLLHSAVEPKKIVALPGWLWALEPVCPPDMALGPNGEVVVTTNVANMVWRIDPQTLAVTVHTLELNSDRGNDIGFVALAYSAEQASFLAYSESPAAVWKIDRELTRATKVANSGLTRQRAQRAASVHGPCADLRSRLMQFGGIAD